MSWYSVAETPIGPLLLVAREEGLVRVHFSPFELPEDIPRDDKRLGRVIRQLDEYFASKRKEFELDLAPRGTEFQLAVWNALRTIRYGQTRSYSQVAQQIGRPAAVRAVGAANGANPLPIVIPCHRVIGSSGSLTGFGGGIDMKRRLLDLEAGYRLL